jgi:thiol-disulfide isomerase/thioredoxin
MKLFFLFLLFGNDPAGEVLQKTFEKLNSSSAFRYYHERDYFTGDRHFITRATNYIDFGSGGNLAGLRYWSEAADVTIIYNGTENFVLDKKEKTIRINNQPTIDGLEGNSFYYNSLVTLRRNLPSLIADQTISKSLKDTLYKDRQAFLVRFSLHKKIMNNFGGYNSITEDRFFHYGLIIDKISFVPLCLLQTNSVDEHSATVTFKNIEFNPKMPGEESWYYSTYTRDYKPASAKAEMVPLSAGLAAPDFQVVDLDTGVAVTLDQFKGKTLLLEFWIRNCGPCIESVPGLNSLRSAFRDLEILAINAHDRKETVDYFVKRYKVDYPVAYQGEIAAKQYGAGAFPVIFLINPKGNIIYSGNFDVEVIKKLLK